MKTAQLLIYQDTRGQGRCRSCGAAVEWAELTSGRRHPFDPPIQPVATQAALFGDNRVIEVVDTTVTKSHFLTCPQRDAWTKQKGA